MKEEEKKVIVMVPYPAQGHVTPMLNLATSLPSLGFRPIIILPEFLHRQMKAKDKDGGAVDAALAGLVQIMSIPDGMEEENSNKGFFEIEKAMEETMPPHLERIIRSLQEGGGVVACVVVDLLASWAIQVCCKCGVAAAGFWPAMLATYRLIAAIPDMLQAALIDSTGIPIHHGQISVQKDLLSMNIQGLPWLIGSLSERQSKFKFWVRTMNRARSIPWLLVNSFVNETKIAKSSPQEGPTIYPIGLLKKYEQEHQIHNPTPRLTFWAEDESCLNWLNQQKPNSVLYISLGTWFSPTDKSKVRMLASSLEDLKRPFLWALGPKWADGLPFGFKERLCDSGKVVAWAPQVQVLQHKAVGCFLTHCGWNSISEAIRCKKCLVCYPLGGDQLLNCVYVVELWKIGVRIEGFGAQEMDENVNRVMGDTNMKKRVSNLYESFMGDEARYKMRANVACFLNQLNKPIN